jgi:protein TonB
MRPTVSGWGVGLAVLTLHGAILLAIARLGPTALPVELTPPSISGRLVSTAPAQRSAPPAPRSPPHARRPIPAKAQPSAPAPRAIKGPMAATNVSTADAGTQTTATESAHDHDLVAPPRSDARGLDNPAPIYPTAARRMAQQGRVLLEVYILADGHVGQVRLKRSSGTERLDQAAIVAVARWHYLPARRGGQPIDYWYIQPIDFVLDN